MFFYSSNALWSCLVLPSLLFVLFPALLSSPPRAAGEVDRANIATILIKFLGAERRITRRRMMSDQRLKVAASVGMISNEMGRFKVDFWISQVDIFMDLHLLSCS